MQTTFSYDSVTTNTNHEQWHQSDSLWKYQPTVECGRHDDQDGIKNPGEQQGLGQSQNKCVGTGLTYDERWNQD